MVNSFLKKIVKNSTIFFLNCSKALQTNKVIYNYIYAILLIRRASTAGVCENQNFLPSEILPRSYHHLQTLGNLFLLSSSSSPGSKEKNINLLEQSNRTSLLLQSNAVASAIAFHHVDVMKSLVKHINNKMKKLLNQPSW